MAEEARRLKCLRSFLILRRRGRATVGLPRVKRAPVEDFDRLRRKPEDGSTTRYFWYGELYLSNCTEGRIPSQANNSVNREDRNHAVPITTEYPATVSHDQGQLIRNPEEA